MNYISLRKAYYTLTDKELKVFSEEGYQNHLYDYIFVAKTKVWVDGKSPIFVEPGAKLNTKIKYQQIELFGNLTYVTRVPKRNSAEFIQGIIAKMEEQELREHAKKG